MSEKDQGSDSAPRCHCGCGAGITGKGPAGVCVCSACGHQVPHEPGTPCREVKCPRCGGDMCRASN
ncbi:MAG: hypothetical protein L6277_01615 [Desulfobacterales bacterium]|nr:hypothetical protein [Pseudomonadota bacterium]MBU4355026.1 hypothetical protein [Pseudomonadota bacterium]MCG2770771.1 hypothetical protein [Desulfobacterales bacterium]